MHEIVKPKTYVEIGIRHGYSLSVAGSAKKIAIDPKYSREDMQFEVGDVAFYNETSDAFFERRSVADIISTPFDLAYIDGMHLFEYALRDFMNLERYSGRSSIIIADDVIPRNEEEADRQPTGGSWTGDVWKVIACLRQHRPDLSENMILAKSEPTGCLIILNPDRTSTVLAENYDAIVEMYLASDYPKMPGDEILNTAVSPQEALNALRRHLSS
ncbi:MAG: class I SAM-dependent methyltransferase [Pseudomonadota bacterium]